MSLISRYQLSFTNIIEEFFIIGVNTVVAAKELTSNPYYLGEILISIPSNSINSTILPYIFPYGLKISDLKLENKEFSMTFNDNMSHFPYYLHGISIYEEITDLCQEAKSLKIDNNTEFAQKIHYNSKNSFDFSKDKVFFPTTLVFKTKGNYHLSLKELLRELIEILREEYLDENNNELLKKIKFTTNLQLILNNCLRPCNGTTLQYILSIFKK